MFHLQELVKQGLRTQELKLQDRLPHHVATPCALTVHYQAEAKDDYYLIHLHVSGLLQLQCQRCLEGFEYAYDNNTIIAVCDNEERAEKMLELYECIVSPHFHVSLEDLVIDELHLYTPQFHPEITDCSSEINQFLSEKNDLD